MRRAGSKGQEKKEKVNRTEYSGLGANNLVPGWVEEEAPIPPNTCCGMPRGSRLSNVRQDYRPAIRMEKP